MERTRLGYSKGVTGHSQNWLEGRGLITQSPQLHAVKGETGLFLLFADGTRPAAADVERHLAALIEPSSANKSLRLARISSNRGSGDGWLELLCGGLTFDLSGLSPASSARMPRSSHFFGLPRSVAEQKFESIKLVPGPHLADGAAMPPVIKIMASLAAELAAGLGAKVICWQPAGSWSDPGYFARIVGAWIEGGPFPALGLTGIELTPEGGAESDGLAFFIGKELRVDAKRGELPADTVKLAVRVIDHLVQNGPFATREKITGTGDETLYIDPSPGGRFVRLRRDFGQHG